MGMANRIKLVLVHTSCHLHLDEKTVDIKVEQKGRSMPETFGNSARKLLVKIISRNRKIGVLGG